MDVFFATQNGFKFCMELGYWDIVFEIKKKIEKYQRIPVPTQTLFFEGNVLQDHLDIKGCKILHNSRVFVLVSNHQVLQPEQPPIRSKSIGDIIYGEDFPLTIQDFENIQLFFPEKTEEIIYIQDSPVNIPMKRISVNVLLPYSGESTVAKNFMFFVNKTDHVRKLRMLVKNRLGDQSRLGDGYFFKRKERILYEDQSFQWNRVGHRNTIEIARDPWLL